MASIIPIHCAAKIIILDQKSHYIFLSWHFPSCLWACEAHKHNLPGFGAAE